MNYIAKIKSLQSSLDKVSNGFAVVRECFGDVEWKEMTLTTQAIPSSEDELNHGQVAMVTMRSAVSDLGDRYLDEHHFCETHGLSLFLNGVLVSGNNSLVTAARAGIIVSMVALLAFEAAWIMGDGIVQFVRLCQEAYADSVFETAVKGVVSRVKAEIDWQVDLWVLHRQDCVIDFIKSSVTAIYYNGRLAWGHVSGRNQMLANAVQK